MGQRHVDKLLKGDLLSHVCRGVPLRLEPPAAGIFKFLSHDLRSGPRQVRLPQKSALKGLAGNVQGVEYGHLYLPIVSGLIIW